MPYINRVWIGFLTTEMTYWCSGFIYTFWKQGWGWRRYWYEGGDQGGCAYRRINFPWINFPKFTPSNPCESCSWWCFSFHGSNHSHLVKEAHCDLGILPWFLRSHIYLRWDGWSSCTDSAWSTRYQLGICKTSKSQSIKMTDLSYNSSPRDSHQSTSDSFCGISKYYVYRRWYSSQVLLQGVLRDVESPSWHLSTGLSLWPTWSSTVLQGGNKPQWTSALSYYMRHQLAWRCVRRVFGSLQALPMLSELLLLNWIHRRNRKVQYYSLFTLLHVSFCSPRWAHAIAPGRSSKDTMIPGCLIRSQSWQSRLV